MDFSGIAAVACSRLAVAAFLGYKSHGVVDFRRDFLRGFSESLAGFMVLRTSYCPGDINIINKRVVQG